MNPFRSEPLAFGSFLVYAPRPKTAAERAAKRHILGPYKRDGLVRTSRGILPATEYLALRLAEEIKAGNAPQLASFFSSDAALTPIPRHVSSARDNRRSEDLAWPPFGLAQALARHGFGNSVHRLLVREHPLRKSAGAANRPSPHEHYESFVVSAQRSLRPPSRITLIDDVITRGSTLLGAAWRLLDTFPKAKIKAFAGVRTMSQGFGSEIVQPVAGTITLDGNRPTRSP